MVGFDIAHLERRIAALEANRGASLRFGKVTGVEGGYARVQLADGHGMVSMPLATLHRRVLRDQDITMPDQGEPVAVLFSGQGLEAGVVLGAVYSPAVPDPAQDAHIDYRRYEDGTELWYDRVRHRLIAKVEGDIEAETTGKVDIHAAGTLAAVAQGDATVESKARISLKAPLIELAGPTVLFRLRRRPGRRRRARQPADSPRRPRRSRRRRDGGKRLPHRTPAHGRRHRLRHVRRTPRRRVMQIGSLGDIVFEVNIPGAGEPSLPRLCRWRAPHASRSIRCWARRRALNSSHLSWTSST